MITVMHDDRAARAMTEAEADKLFADLAGEVIMLTRKAAEHEAQLAAIKAQAAKDKATSEAILKPMVEELLAYIQAHPRRFEKPRSRKTPFGSYGLRDVSNLEITDEAALLKSLMVHGITEGYAIEHTIAKKVVESLIRAGDERISGARIIEGIRAGYKVKDELIKNAKNAGVEA